MLAKAQRAQQFAEEHPVSWDATEHGSLPSVGQEKQKAQEGFSQVLI